MQLGEAVREQAGRNQWLAIAPELMLGLIALLLLVLELALPKAQRGLIPGIAIVSQIAVLVALIINLSTPYIGAGPTFNGLLQHTGGGQFLRIFFLLASILTCVLGTVSLPRQRMPHIEFYHILLVVTAAMMLLAQANHFVMLFVALETTSLSQFILAGIARNARSSEAGLKYLLGQHFAFVDAIGQQQPRPVIATGLGSGDGPAPEVGQAVVRHPTPRSDAVARRRAPGLWRSPVPPVRPLRCAAPDRIGPGQRVLILAGIPFGSPGSANILRLAYAPR